MKKSILILNNKFIKKDILEKLKKKFLVIEKNIHSRNELKKYLLILKKKEIKISYIFASLGIYYDNYLFNLTKPNLKYFVTPTTGLDHINLKHLSKLNIKLIYLYYLNYHYVG